MTLKNKLLLLGISKAKQVKVERAKYLSNDNGKFVRLRGQKFPLEWQVLQLLRFRGNITSH